MRTSNPVLNDDVFAPRSEWITVENKMTLQGTVNKTFLLLALVVTTAAWTWRLFYAGGMAAVAPWWIGGLIGGLVLALVTTFKSKAAPVTAPLYALAQGLALGGLSALFEQRFHGIVIQAVALTFGVLFFLLGLYTSKLIRATENFKLGVVAATGGIFFFYVVCMVLSLFGVNVPMLHSGGPIGILFSLFVVVVAALNLVLDFDFIESGADRGAPKHMEWYGAFGVMVTLIWLYVAILRLLANSRGRN